jgi:hypothetical protein
MRLQIASLSLAEKSARRNKGMIELGIQDTYIYRCAERVKKTFQRVQNLIFLQKKSNFALSAPLLGRVLV